MIYTLLYMVLICSNNPPKNRVLPGWTVMFPTSFPGSQLASFWGLLHSIPINLQYLEQTNGGFLHFGILKTIGFNTKML